VRLSRIQRTSYGAAQARLRKALVGVAAGDAVPIMTRVFEDGLPVPLTLQAIADDLIE
jgi:hypothetical protein